MSGTVDRNTAPHHADQLAYPGECEERTQKDAGPEMPVTCGSDGGQDGRSLVRQLSLTKCYDKVGCHADRGPRDDESQRRSSEHRTRDDDRRSRTVS
ncbi:hypothetical protein TTY48_18550 [Tsukamurella sp. TY48]|nr:hypothetical protein TTY48_18550 [Tsukamurella sp. TY48]